MNSTSQRLTRIALLIPSSNTVMENDLHKGLPAHLYSVHTDRMYLVQTTREAEIKMIEQHARPAARDLATVAPDLFVFGCTSAGSLFGLDYDSRLCHELGEIAGCPGQGVVSAASAALDRTGARSLAVITPYNNDLTQSVARALTESGRQVVAAHGMGITDNIALAEPDPEQIIAFASEHLENLDFDALFVSCTNFRAMEARDRLRAVFDVPVVTSNSAVIDAIRDRYENGYLQRAA